MIIQILAKVGSLFLMIVVGALARFKRVISDEALDALCKIVLYVTLPFLFIFVLSSKCLGNTIFTLWKAPIFAALIILTGFIVASVAAKFLGLSGKKKDTFTFLVSFQNSGFLAIPIGFILFGEEGVLNIVIFNIGFNILLWTFGIWLCTRSEKGIKTKPLTNLINTGTIALALGLLLGIFCVKLPVFVLDTCKILGDATIPLAMLVVGAILAGGRSSDAARPRIKEMATLVFCRLILIPLIFLGVAKFIPGISDLMRSVIVLQACMPSGATSAIFAKRFGGDQNMAANGIFYTTLISIITIPIFMSLI